MFVVGGYVGERIEYQDVVTVDRLLLWYSTKNGDRSDLVWRTVVECGSLLGIRDVDWSIVCGLGV